MILTRIKKTFISLVFIFMILPQTSQANFDGALFDDDFYAWYASGNRELQVIDGNILDFIGAKWGIFLSENWSVGLAYAQLVGDLSGTSSGTGLSTALAPRDFSLSLLGYELSYTIRTDSWYDIAFNTRITRLMMAYGYDATFIGYNALSFDIGFDFLIKLTDRFALSIGYLYRQDLDPGSDGRPAEVSNLSGHAITNLFYVMSF